MGQVTVSVPGIVVCPDGIDVQEEGMVTEVKALQPAKTLSPILVTDVGMVTELKEVQPEKALPPILVTDVGMATEVKAVQP